MKDPAVQVIATLIALTCLCPTRDFNNLITEKANSVKAEGAKPWVLPRVSRKDCQVTEA